MFLTIQCTRSHSQSLDSISNEVSKWRFVFVCIGKWNEWISQTWLLTGSYGTMRFCPLTSCSIRPRIGIAWSSIFCSNPTRANALRPRTESAKLILRPWTNSAVRISVEWKLQFQIFFCHSNQFGVRFNSYLLDIRINEHHALFSPNVVPPMNQPVPI